jgi:ribosomal protein S6--L-glutamate ligase
MILSYHPCYEAEVNLLCAGRDPDPNDLAAIQRAAAVILPQGCKQTLYRIAKDNCRHVFPNYDARFAYPGKTGQARLFRVLSISHPQTWIFSDLNQFKRWQQTVSTIDYPKVFKLDWGGEGETVMLLESPIDLDQALSKVADYEKSGQKGFVLQSVVPHANRTLRVVVIGQTFKLYWKVQDNLDIFGDSV